MTAFWTPLLVFELRLATSTKICQNDWAETNASNSTSNLRRNLAEGSHTAGIQMKHITTAFWAPAVIFELRLSISKKTYKNGFSSLNARNSTFNRGRKLVMGLYTAGIKFEQRTLWQFFEHLYSFLSYD